MRSLSLRCALCALCALCAIIASSCNVDDDQIKPPARATCVDGIRNQGELGVDCGGPCPACQEPATCADGAQNQGETGVDCGGPCPACQAAPTCVDGIQNQGEQGVDCGGPCPACQPAARCGDGVVQPEAGEQCDETPKSDCDYGQQRCMVCNDQCRLVAGRVTGFCGDGVVQSAAGEQCEPSAFQAAACGATSYGQTTCLPDCTISEEGCFDVLSVHSGSRHTCAIITAGRVMCWGDNRAGQLGLSPSDRPVMAPTLVPGLAQVTSLALGAEHTCALQGDQVLCWGANDYGQLGDATTTARHEPALIPALSGATALWSGTSHSCATLADDTVACWGYNGHGQIGLGGPPTRYQEPSVYDATSPRVIPGAATCVELGMGSFSTYCATRDARGLAWGYNTGRGLGVGTGNAYEILPLPILNVSDLVQLVGGFRHTCGRHARGGVSCWGYNDHGQAGRPPQATSFSPAAMPGLDSTSQLQSGNNHACALTSFWRVLCWGLNNNGQLGRGQTLANAHVPASVEQLSFSALSIHPSGNHTCALSRDGRLYCWGLNRDGQLGDGTTIDRASPVLTAF